MQDLKEKLVDTQNKTDDESREEKLENHNTGGGSVNWKIGNEQLRDDTQQLKQTFRDQEEYGREFKDFENIWQILKLQI